MSGDVSLVAGQRHGYIQTAFCNAQHTYPGEISDIFSQTFHEDVDITQVTVCSFSAVTKLRMRICQTCSISGHTGNYNLLRFASIKDFDAGSEDNILSLSWTPTPPLGACSRA